MDNLFRWIDELVSDECLPWRRDGRRLRVFLSRNGRSQIVRLGRRKDRYVLSSVIAHMAAVNEDRRSLAFRLWRRNALKAVVTFTIDRRERAIGLIDQQIESVHPTEIRFYLDTLARECDRLEYILTGAGYQVRGTGIFETFSGTLTPGQLAVLGLARCFLEDSLPTCPEHRRPIELV